MKPTNCGLYWPTLSKKVPTTPFSETCSGSFKSRGSDSKCNLVLSPETDLSTAATETILHTTVFKYGVGSSSVAPPSLHMCRRTSKSGASSGTLYKSLPATGSGIHSASNAQTRFLTVLNITFISQSPWALIASSICFMISVAESFCRLSEMSQKLFSDVSSVNWIFRHKCS